jgi:hypothetical protein
MERKDEGNLRSPGPERAWRYCASSSDQSSATDGGSIALTELGSSASLDGWAIVSSDGKFRRILEFLPGAIDARVMLVRDDLDPDGSFDIIDAVAWDADDPSAWWTWTGKLDYLGEYELRRARWENRPARMVSRPVDFRGDTFCLIRWDAEIDSILAGVPGVACDTPELTAKLRQSWVEQATATRRRVEAAARRFPIVVGQRPGAA